MTVPSGGAPDRALDEAARTVATGVRAAALLLATAFAATGAWWVDEGTAVVRLRFGAIAEDGVLLPGGPRIGWPAPVDERFVVPTTLAETRIDTAFTAASADGPKRRPAGLDPATDGSLLTGDRNLLHARFTVTWVVRSAEPGSVLAWARNVGTAENAHRLVAAAAEEAVVAVAATTPVDAALRQGLDTARIAALAQRVLSRLDTGISVASVTATDVAPPAAVAADFPEVTKAESERAQRIEEAGREFSRRLQEAAGPAAMPLLDALAAADAAHAAGDEGAAADSERRARELLDSGGVAGAAAEVLGRARSVRTAVMESGRTAADRFRHISALPPAERRILCDRLLRDVADRVLAAAARTTVLPAGPGRVLWIEPDGPPHSPSPAGAR